MNKLINVISKNYEKEIYNINKNKLNKINSVAGKELSYKQLKLLFREGLNLYFYNIRKTILLFCTAATGSLLFDKNMIVIILIEYILTGIIRKYSGGIHLNTVACTIWGFITYFSGYFYSVYADYNFSINLFIFILSEIVFTLYSPKEIKGLKCKKKNYLSRKIKTIMIAGLLFALTHIISSIQLKNLIIWILVIQSLHITPIAFKIFKVED